MVVVPEGPRLEKIRTRADILWCQMFTIVMDEMVIINHRQIIRYYDQKVNYFRHFYQNDSESNYSSNRNEVMDL